MKRSRRRRRRRRCHHRRHRRRRRSPAKARQTATAEQGETSMFTRVYSCQPDGEGLK